MTTGNEKKPARLPASGQSEIMRRYVAAPAPSCLRTPRAITLRALIAACQALETAARSQLEQEGR